MPLANLLASLEGGGFGNVPHRLRPPGQPERPGDVDYTDPPPHEVNDTEGTDAP